MPKKRSRSGERHSPIKKKICLDKSHITPPPPLSPSETAVDKNHTLTLQPRHPPATAVYNNHTFKQTHQTSSGTAVYDEFKHLHVPLPLPVHATPVSHAGISATACTLQLAMAYAKIATPPEIAMAHAENVTSLNGAISWAGMSATPHIAIPHAEIPAPRDSLPANAISHADISTTCKAAISPHGNMNDIVKISSAAAAPATVCSSVGRRAASLARARHNFRDVRLTAQRTVTSISIGVPSNINDVGQKRVALVPNNVAKLFTPEMVFQQVEILPANVSLPLATSNASLPLATTTNAPAPLATTNASLPLATIIEPQHFTKDQFKVVCVTLGCSIALLFLVSTLQFACFQFVASFCMDKCWNLWDYVQTSVVMSSPVWMFAD